jgi:3-keto-disaccharide hydrolase
MRIMRQLCVSLAMASAAALILVGLSRAQDSTKGDSWTQLFNGKNLDGWTDAQGRPAKGWVVEDGAIVRKPNSGDIWTKQRYGNFVLELEFKTKGNSGVFIRTDKPTDNVQTGIEIQIDNPSRTPGKHSLGAVYDAQAPSKSTGKRDDWNKMAITAKDNKLTVSLNGEQIVDMDLDRWKDAGKNPDGSANKFTTALKDFKREGHIGFQDHGSDVMYRNVRLRPIK